ncbi:MAG: DsbA family protein [Anaerolineae bacterium]|nr:DsbA family protein [Anaerolineae bacterium]
MRRIVMIVLLAAFAVVPVMAQDATAEPAPALPPGCNLSVLSEVFTSVGTALKDAQLPVNQAVGLMGAFESLLADTQTACTGEPVPLPEGAIDYSAIEQTRLDDGGFVLGSPDAPITIVEFADFLCPHCQEYDAVIRDFITQYVVTGKARLEYRTFPVIDAQLSPLTAALAECSDTINPGTFWQARSIMYSLSEEGYNDLVPFRFAALAGLDFNALADCVGTANQVQVDAALGQSAGVEGTPAVRMRDADGNLVVITYQGSTLDRGGMPLEVLGAVVEAAQ